jgi:GH15 family glucan-1,4-alpha-glucosidase
MEAIAGPNRLTLHTDVPLHGEGLKTVGEFAVAAGETVSFNLTYSASHLPAVEKIDVSAALTDTETYWRKWAAQCNSAGEWSDATIRSLITLKALTYRPTGGIVAAPTTSLPEKLRGMRNWDYRFCWLRDATLTLLALMGAGYYDEAQAWRDWLLRAAAGSPAQLQIMYGLAGERRLTEWEVPWLPGYEGAKPVRIGNAAHAQLQLDVYGEVLDALHAARRGKLGPNDAGWSLQCAMLAHLETVWRCPDEGIWEVRGEPRHFIYSKIMAWVAFDRGIKAVEEHGLKAPVERWRRIRRQIHDEVCRHGFNTRLNSFVQAYGSSELDASLLLIPIVGFLPADDPRVRSTLAAIERHLVVDGFVLRYDTAHAADGLPPGEGCFLACSFWLADAYVMQGRVQEARHLFERLMALRNDVGLLSEEYDPRQHRLVGNFPQAFSHVALVNTALNLTQAAKPAEQRGDRVSAPSAAVTRSADQSSIDRGNSEMSSNPGSHDRRPPHSKLETGQQESAVTASSSSNGRSNGPTAAIPNVVAAEEFCESALAIRRMHAA